MTASPIPHMAANMQNRYTRSGSGVQSMRVICVPPCNSKATITLNIIKNVLIFIFHKVNLYMNTNSFAIHVYINIFIHIANVLMDFGLVYSFFTFFLMKKLPLLLIICFSNFECSLITQHKERNVTHKLDQSPKGKRTRSVHHAIAYHDVANVPDSQSAAHIRL